VESGARLDEEGPRLARGVHVFDVRDPERHLGMARRCSAAHLLQRSGFRVQGSGFRVQGSGFRGQGSGFRVQGAGCRVQGAAHRKRDVAAGLAVAAALRLVR